MPDEQTEPEIDIEKAFRNQLFRELERRKIGYCAHLLTRKGALPKRILGEALGFYMQQRGTVDERMDATVRLVVHELSKKLAEFIGRVDAILKEPKPDAT